jgi:N-carbamoyl-D-amino-acid hydrolase
MIHSRKLGLAVAQMGPVNLADDRRRVVGRLVAMPREAKRGGAQLVVFPELALTTFFPRYCMSEQQAVERFFERSMPNADVQPLFDNALALGVGSSWAMPKRRPTNTGSIPPCSSASKTAFI